MKRTNSRATLLPTVLILFAVHLFATPAVAQLPSSPIPTATPSASTPIPTPIPLALVATEAEQTDTKLQEMSAELKSDSENDIITQDLKVLTREIDARFTESGRVLATTTSLEILKEQDLGWQKIRETLSDWNRNLARRVTRIDSQVGDLTTLTHGWDGTRSLSKASNAPAETLERIASIQSRLHTTLELLGSHRADLLKLQAAVVEQTARIDAELVVIDRARDTAMGRLFVRDSPPIWSLARAVRERDGISRDTQDSFADQTTALSAYAEREAGSFLIHALLFVVLLAAAFRVRRTVVLWTEHDPDLVSATAVFQAPISLALLISLLATHWIHPQAPRLFWAFIGAGALLPTVFILRRALEPHMRPILWSLVAFYFVDQIRLVVAALPVISRALFMAEMMMAMGSIAWNTRAGAGCAEDVPAAEHRFWRAVCALSRSAALLLFVAFLAEALGYVNLANLLGQGVFAGAYAAVIFYALVRVLDGLFFFAMRIPPLSLFRIVRLHTPLIMKRARFLFTWCAVLLWVAFFLEKLSVRADVMEQLDHLLSAQFGVGSIVISLGSLFAFIITAWGAILLSRFIRFILEEEVYPRTSLSRGLPYAISTVIHYLVLLVGFFFAIAALGFDMTKFTILAGAFGVGLGFGLQNIINNFFSGLIVLFERPVRVGDVIQMDDVEGIVERIGIRASFIRTIHGSEVIIPNGKLISERVINWTFSNRQRAIEIPLTVAYGTDPQRVIEILRTAAVQHPLIATDPAPEVVATKFGTDSLTFELRAFTNRFLDWVNIRSDLAVRIHTALVAEKILIR